MLVSRDVEVRVVCVKQRLYALLAAWPITQSLGVDGAVGERVEVTTVGRAVAVDDDPVGVGASLLQVGVQPGVLGGAHVLDDGVGHEVHLRVHSRHVHGGTTADVLPTQAVTHEERSAAEVVVRGTDRCCEWSGCVPAEPHVGVAARDTAEVVVRHEPVLIVTGVVGVLCNAHHTHST
jgi:hypothetical protein